MAGQGSFRPSVVPFEINPKRVATKNREKTPQYPTIDFLFRCILRKKTAADSGRGMGWGDGRVGREP